MAVRRHCRPRCDTCSSPSSARFLYLVGAALLYGSYATLDIVLLSRRVHMEPATLVAATLMTIGLFAKTALFPLHLWLSRRPMPVRRRPPARFFRRWS